MNTFDEFGEFWKMGGSGDQILSPGPRYVSDFCADVCSRQATRPALMRLTSGRRKQHCQGAGWPTSRVCVIPLAHQRPGRGFRQRLGRGASLSYTLRRGASVIGRHGWMAEPGTQLLYGREAVLNLPERRRPLALAANPPAARRPRCRAGASRS